MQNKNAPVIAVTNRKGGVGKTTMAVHLAAGLSGAHGKRVMLVDADSQGQCALLLGLAEMNGLYELIVNQQPVDQVVQQVPPELYEVEGNQPGQMYLLPGSSLTFSISDHIDEMAIVQLFADLAAMYQLDVIIVDTQPSISKLDAALWLAVDYFLYVTTLDRLGVAGLQSAIEQLINFNPNRTLHGLPTTKVMGIIPNRVTKATLVNETVGRELTGMYRHLVWLPVLERTTWQRAAQLGRMVYKYSHGQAVIDCWEMVRKVKEHLNGE